LVFILLFIFIFVYIFSFYAYNPFESDNSKKFEYGVVFGAKVISRNNQAIMSDALFDRTMTAIELFKSKKIDFLIFSGGESNGFLEPEIMKKLALKHNIPSEKIILDNLGFNTISTIKNSPKESVLFISNDFHISRINYFIKNFQELNIKNSDVYPANYYYLRYTKEVIFVFREALALIYYFLFFEVQDSKES
jgi:vancomycin permeability regulator SanA